MHAIAEENNASCASYASPTNYQAARWDDDSASATISIVDLTSIGEDGSRTLPRMSRPREAARPCVPCGTVRLPFLLFLAGDRTFTSSVLSPVVMKTTDEGREGLGCRPPPS